MYSSAKSTVTLMPPRCPVPVHHYLKWRAAESVRLAEAGKRLAQTIRDGIAAEQATATPDTWINQHDPIQPIPPETEADPDQE